MRKGERIVSFLSRIQEIHDQLALVGSTPSPTAMVRLALNAVTNDWQVFFQSILGRATLPGWVEMWAALQQEELRRDLVKCKLDSNSGSGSKVKQEEEENVALASKRQQEQWRHKKDISKIKCFKCGEPGHYAS